MVDPRTPDLGDPRCPRCEQPLPAPASPGVLRCRGCGGVFVGREEVEAFLATLSPSEGDGYRTAAPPPGERATPSARPAWEPHVRYLMCARCGQPMMRSNFARVSGVIVDVCPNHGTWFDSGEAEVVARWVEQLPTLRRLEQEHTSRTSRPPSTGELREQLLSALRSGAG